MQSIKNIRRNEVKCSILGRFSFNEGKLDFILYNIWWLLLSCSACEVNQELSSEFMAWFSLLSLACQTLGRHTAGSHHSGTAPRSLYSDNVKLAFPLLPLVAPPFFFKSLTWNVQRYSFLPHCFFIVISLFLASSWAFLSDEACWFTAFSDTYLAETHTCPRGSLLFQPLRISFTGGETILRKVAFLIWLVRDSANWARWLVWRCSFVDKLNGWCLQAHTCARGCFS